jgi:hypothetical protein
VARSLAPRPYLENLIVLEIKTKQSDDTVTKDNTAAAETHAQKKHDFNSVFDVRSTDVQDVRNLCGNHREVLELIRTHLF